MHNFVKMAAELPQVTFTIWSPCSSRSCGWLLAASRRQGYAPSVRETWQLPTVAALAQDMAAAARPKAHRGTHGDGTSAAGY